MKVRIFYDSETQTLEEQLNTWLEQNPGVYDIEYSISGERESAMVIYDERTVPPP